MSGFQNDNAVLFYSMWNGYLKNQRIAEFLDDMKAEPLHTSGHATKEAIKAVCEAVRPRQVIIPIHSDHTEKMSELNLAYPVKILNDGEVFTI